MRLGKRRRGAEAPVPQQQDSDGDEATAREVLHRDSDSERGNSEAPDAQLHAEAVEADGVDAVSNHRSRHRRTNRRRAHTACQLCRSRKTKCDNKRPSCGYCSFHGAVCIYTEPDADAIQSQAQNVSNGVLLERLNHVVNLLEGVQHPAGSSSIAAPAIHGLGEAPLQHILPQEPNHLSAFSDEGFGQLEVSELAAKTSACESILRWPALRDLCGDKTVTSFPLQSTREFEADGAVTSLSNGSSGADRRPVLQEENIWPLCQRFLVLIHIKNPILEVSSLKRYARQSAEYGPGWDGPGCLVLLACALACVAMPYEPSQTAPFPESSPWTPGSTLPAASQGDLAAGDVYFEAAKRRLGTLSHSLLSVQCHYFAGLYEKFAVRPLAAWMLLQQACIQAQAYLYAKALSQASGTSPDVRLRHIEQRLYWSCVKAECELRADLQLPASGLLRFKYPDLFPFLSFPSASEPAESPGWTETSPGGQSLSEGALRPEEERSWLYYLAEISLRKIMNRVLDGLYSRGEQCWLDDVNKSVLQHAAFTEEIALWRSNLPPSLRFSDTEQPRNEFSFFLKTRYLWCLEWIHRPILFFVLHRPEDPRVNDLLHLARDCVNICVALIPLISRHHRHGGIWSLLRKSFGCSLLLVAANEKQPLIAASLPEDWQSLVRLCICTIDKWQSGTSDVRWMGQILQDVLSRVDT